MSTIASSSSAPRRLASLLFCNHRRTLLPLAPSLPLSRGFQPSPLLGLFPSTRFLRGFQTQTQNKNDSEDAEEIEIDVKTTKDTTSINNIIKGGSSSLKTSARHDLAMVFTCRVCETRSVKTACKESYEKGVVVARCGGCNNLHLIADRLGWFGQPGSVEDFLKARGEQVVKGSADTLSLTLDDLAGTGTGTGTGTTTKS